MCIEIHIVVMWKKIDFNLIYYFIVSIYKNETNSIVRDEKRILLAQKIVIL